MKSKEAGTIDLLEMVGTGIKDIQAYQRQKEEREKYQNMSEEEKREYMTRKIFEAANNSGNKILKELAGGLYTGDKEIRYDLKDDESSINYGYANEDNRTIQLSEKILNEVIEQGGATGDILARAASTAGRESWLIDRHREIESGNKAEAERLSEEALNKNLEIEASRQQMGILASLAQAGYTLDMNNVRSLLMMSGLEYSVANNTDGMFDYASGRALSATKEQLEKLKELKKNDKILAIFVDSIGARLFENYQKEKQPSLLEKKYGGDVEKLLSSALLDQHNPGELRAEYKKSFEYLKEHLEEIKDPTTREYIKNTTVEELAKSLATYSCRMQATWLYGVVNGEESRELGEFTQDVIKDGTVKTFQYTDKEGNVKTGIGYVTNNNLVALYGGTGDQNKNAEYKPLTEDYVEEYLKGKSWAIFGFDNTANGKAGKEKHWVLGQKRGDEWYLRDHSGTDFRNERISKNYKRLYFIVK